MQKQKTRQAEGGVHVSCSCTLTFCRAFSLSSSLRTVLSRLVVVVVSSFSSWTIFFSRASTSSLACNTLGCTHILQGLLLLLQPLVGVHQLLLGLVQVVLQLLHLLLQLPDLLLSLG